MDVIVDVNDDSRKIAKRFQGELPNIYLPFLTSAQMRMHTNG